MTDNYLQIHVVDLSPDVFVNVSLVPIDPVHSFVDILTLSIFSLINTQGQTLLFALLSPEASGGWNRLKTKARALQDTVFLSLESLRLNGSQDIENIVVFTETWSTQGKFDDERRWLYKAICIIDTSQAEGRLNFTN